MVLYSRPAYPIRELRAHLARQGMAVSVKYLQRFCAQHGIKRDGAPAAHVHASLTAQPKPAPTATAPGHAAGPPRHTLTAFDNCARPAGGKLESAAELVRR